MNNILEIFTITATSQTQRQKNLWQFAELPYKQRKASQVEKNQLNFQKIPYTCQCILHKDNVVLVKIAAANSQLSAKTCTHELDYSSFFAMLPKK